MNLSEANVIFIIHLTFFFFPPILWFHSCYASI